MTTYWIDLFTPETWEEARAFDHAISGFSAAREGFAKGIQAGDILLCYVGAGVSRWVGALCAESEVYHSEMPRIWKSAPYPIRVRTKPLVALSVEQGIPFSELAPSLTMFRELQDPKKWGTLVQGSPARLKHAEDGAVIVKALEAAAENPVTRPLPEKRKSTRKSIVEPPLREVRDRADVLVPEEKPAPAQAEDRAHTEIQFLLLELGSNLGLDVWAARNDRSAQWSGGRIRDIPRLRESLPEQFDPITQRIVELIDVLWIERDGIRYAFEVENSTNIYGGVLRMSDLLARRPHLDIPLYIVGPDERYQKVIQELNRPTFAAMNRPLVEVCKFIPYSKLRDGVRRWSAEVGFMRPNVIDTIALDCRI